MVLDPKQITELLAKGAGCMAVSEDGSVPELERIRIHHLADGMLDQSEQAAIATRLFVLLCHDAS